MVLEGKQIVMGVCGGIAAYKSVELLRLMVKQGARVRVVMTENARWFVGPTTYEALSGQPVCKTLFDPGSDASIRHIDWAQTADAVVVAPATANMVAKMATGLADDALSTFLLAVTCPILVCPSMNTQMYLSRPVQRNIEVLKTYGIHVLAPDAGELACGTTGPGRLPDPPIILDRLTRLLLPKDLSGRNVLVTAGPTREPMDPVRFISNPSSGKMGYAIARAAEHRGATVTLVSGPVELADPLNVNVVRVTTAREMAESVFEHMEDAHIIVKTAAVSDYRPDTTAKHKIKKGAAEKNLKLVKNQDILKTVGQNKQDRVLVGFAAETEALEKNAGKKLSEKNLDIIVGNIVGSAESGFGSDNNTVTFFFSDGKRESLPSMAKENVAHLLLDRIAELTERGQATEGG